MHNKLKSVANATMMGVGLLWVLTACVPESEQQSATDGTSSAASTTAKPSAPTAVPQPPTTTSLSSEDDVQTWLNHVSAVLDYAYLTGDTGPVARVTAPDCAPCIQQFATVRDVYEHGGWSQAPKLSYQVESMQRDGSETESVRAVVSVSSQAVVQRDVDGKKLREIPALSSDSAAVEIHLTRAGNRWTVDTLPLPDARSAD